MIIEEMEEKIKLTLLQYGKSYYLFLKVYCCGGYSEQREKNI